MKIGIIGSGTMGKSLAELLSQKKHVIMLGTRRPAAIEQWVKENGHKIQVGTYSDAAQSNDIIFLVTSFRETQSAVLAMGEIPDKVLVDCTNPEDPDNNYEHRTGTSISWAEEIASWTPTAKLVKAFNHLYGSMLLTGTDFNGTKASLFYCGDDIAAKSIVATLAKDLNLDPIDVGELKRARQLEPLAELLVHLASKPGADGSDIAFKLLKR
ncbi:MAG: NADPH-dependent F420 reductase [Candidatus Marinimicrobia bacterium]|nr:NADPH-dependent F420 reductase [Candidatus Neomarinimicrobiota bacterium]